jgi:hypothetical protein
MASSTQWHYVSSGANANSKAMANAKYKYKCRWQIHIKKDGKLSKWNTHQLPSKNFQNT